MITLHARQGQMESELCYFYTDTIYNFKHLLADDALKMICIDSWKYLTEKELIKIAIKTVFYYLISNVYFPETNCIL